MLSTDNSEIHLWFAVPGEITDPRLLDEYQTMLTDSEREKQSRFYFASDRHRYLITRALVRTVLSRYAAAQPRDWIFEADDFGRPHIVNLPPSKLGLSFNISHTDGLILLGVTKGAAIGVDVENLGSRELSIAVADRYFAPEELAVLHSLPEARQKSHFFDLWTLKESYIKARGMGLSIPLDRFSFCFPADHVIGFSTDPSLGDDFARWQFWQFQLAPGFCAAVCAERANHSKPALKFTRTVPLDKDTPTHFALLRQSPA